MRLGLIGLGRIGSFHADTLSRLAAVDSLVVTDAVPAVTKIVAERVHAQPADSPESLINSGVDAIVVAAATNAHTQLIRDGVDAGIPVFCEKPLSGDIAQAAARLPMGKLGQVDEIADFVVFLLSDRSGVVSGSVIDWDQNVIGGLGD